VRRPLKDLALKGDTQLLARYRHWKTNEILHKDEHHDVSNPLHRSTRFYRRDLQAALAKHIPSSLIQFGKRAISIDIEHTNGARIQFEDGTDATADVVVGADGMMRSVSF
jgi:salicylate hydroxylase